jgi:hypothetical protein
MMDRRSFVGWSVGGIATLCSVQSALADAQYTVRIRSYRGQYLSASGGGGGPIFANRPTGAGAWETFFVTTLGSSAIAHGSYVRIQARDGEYLCAERDETVYANRPQASTWEMWRVVKLGGSGGAMVRSGDPIALEAYTGKHMVADYDAPDNQVRANRTSIGTWESFSITYVRVYDRWTAMRYARQWAYGTNPSFGRMGWGQSEDCTNFVSQCLRTGGWVDRGSGYENRQNAYLWFFDTSKRQGSYSWTSSRYFYTCAGYSGRAHLVAYASDLDIGDVIEFKWRGNGDISHSAIVSRKDADGSVWLAQHSKDYDEKSLSSYPDASRYYWHLHDNYEML